MRLAMPSSDRTLVMLLGLVAAWIVVKTAYCASWSWIHSEPVELIRTLLIVLSSWIQWVVFLPLIHGLAKRFPLLAAPRHAIALYRHAILAVLFAGTSAVLKYHMASTLQEYTAADAVMIHFPQALLVYVLLVAVCSGVRLGEHGHERTRCGEVIQADTPRGRASVAIDRIEVVSAQRNYVELCAGERSYLLRHTLKGLEQQLRGHGFVRIHRSHLVNRKHVRELSRGEVVMASGQRVPIGRHYRECAASLIA